MTTFSVVINDPSDLEPASIEALITANVQAAGELWANHILGVGNIQVQVSILSSFSSSSTLAQGGSDHLDLEGVVNGIELYQQSTKTVITTGIHSRGTPPDAFIDVSPSSINNMFLDPNPTARTSPIPFGAPDAISVFTHEIGHALGFNGWRSGTTGALSTFDTARRLPYQSDFDSYVTFVGGNLYFNGPKAMAVYGGPVPVEYGDYGHIGNRSPRPGSNLTTDLMYGTALNGTREYISALDIAILQDTGLPLSSLGDFVIHNFGADTTVSAVAGYTSVNYSLAATKITANLTTGIGTDGVGGTAQLVGVNNVTGSNFGDALVGNAQANTFDDGAGTNTIDGGPGYDTLIFSGVRAAYTIANAAPNIIVTDSASQRDGINTVTNVEYLQFADKTVFVESTENANVGRLYSAALGRAPDRGGLAYWETQYATVSTAAKAQGVYVSLAQTSGGFNGNQSIAAGFTTSAEFQQKYGPLDDTGFVTQMYANVLGRAPEASGLNFWLDAMHSGYQGQTFTREMVLVGFAESPENIAKAAADWLFVA